MAFVQSGTVEQFDDEIEEAMTEGVYDWKNGGGTRVLTKDEAFIRFVGSTDVYEVELPLRATYRVIVGEATSEAQAIRAAEDFIRDHLENIISHMCCGNIEGLETTAY